jgi:hypothetical protein
MDPALPSLSFLGHHLTLSTPSQSQVVPTLRVVKGLQVLFNRFEAWPAAIKGEHR